MLFGSRRRLQEMEAKEAQGHSFWTNSFSERVRNKVIFATGDHATPFLEAALEHAHHLLVPDEGMIFLGQSQKQTPPVQVLEYLSRCSDDRAVPHCQG